jgi:uncharacterized repeat protein (TIGR01451 family)
MEKAYLPKDNEARILEAWNTKAYSNPDNLPQQDVEIVKTASVATVPQGGTYTYTLTARNLTAVPAQNVVITDQVPAGLTISSVPAGCTAAGNTVTCNIGTLGANATRAFTVGITVPGNAVCPGVSGGTFKNDNSKPIKLRANSGTESNCNRGWICE